MKKSSPIFICGYKPGIFIFLGNRKKIENIINYVIYFSEQVG